MTRFPWLMMGNKWGSEMTEYSEAAWNIARLYSFALASEARDLAAHVDAAIAAERERCAKVAENYSNVKPGDICEVQAGDWQHEIAEAIRQGALK